MRRFYLIRSIRCWCSRICRSLPGADQLKTAPDLGNAVRMPEWEPFACPFLQLSLEIEDKICSTIYIEPFALLGRLHSKKIRMNQRKNRDVKCNILFEMLHFCFYTYIIGRSGQYLTPKNQKIKNILLCNAPYFGAFFVDATFQTVRCICWMRKCVGTHTDHFL